MTALYVDMTTAYQEQHRIAHGTTRVERGILAGLAALRRPDVEFCRYDRSAGAFVAVATEDALHIAITDGVPEPRRDPAPAWRLHGLSRTGKSLEKWVRRNVRDRLRRHLAAAPQRLDATPLLFTAGSTLLLPGELQRHDCAVLTRLRRRLPLRLAFVFHDLLDVLPPDDPRLSDPTTSDLPSSDFITREADVVLCNSAYSKNILLAHMASRGVPAPTVEVLRLGHFVRETPSAVAAPDGLHPGTFVLAVGDVVPRKNHALLVKVWRALLRQRPADVKPLVIVGRVGSEGAGVARDISADPALAAHVRLLSNADDRTLDWLYAHCAFTVFPSLMEGYGLPVSESLAAGKVCVASSRAAIPEASQGYGIHLDPDDLESWIACIAGLLTDPAALRRATERIGGFRAVTWSDTAKDILARLAEPPQGDAAAVSAVAAHK